MLMSSFFRSIFRRISQRHPLTEKSESGRAGASNEIFMSKNSQYALFDIGDWTYGHPQIHKWDKKTKLTIGKYCSIAGNVQILLGGEHRMDWVTTYPFNILFPEAAQFQGHPATKGDIRIGNDVWIGQNAIILSGVVLGNGAVIGAGSLITSDVPAYAIAAGNPAKIVRKRFSDDQIVELEKIAWWNWSRDKVISSLPFLLSNDINEFINKYSCRGAL